MPELTDFIRCYADCWFCNDRAIWNEGLDSISAAKDLHRKQWRIVKLEDLFHGLACPKCVKKMAESGAIKEKSV